MQKQRYLLVLGRCKHSASFTYPLATHHSTNELFPDFLCHMYQDQRSALEPQVYLERKRLQYMLQSIESC
jgi:hypothetical protein